MSPKVQMRSCCCPLWLWLLLRMRVLSSSPSAALGWFPHCCPLTVSEGVVLQGWIAFPVFIDGCGPLMPPSDALAVQRPGGKEAGRGGEAPAHSSTQRHRSRPRRSLKCFLCFHWETANIHVRGAAADGHRRDVGGRPGNAGSGCQRCLKRCRRSGWD